MNCQQKSGVFLNIHCSNTKENNCSNCKKEVCETHTHLLESKHYCEDCYWELFMFYKEERPYHDNDTFITDTNTTPYASSTSHDNSSDSGFGGGFGGGGFGGGGANGQWTEGDMQSLSDTDSQGGILSDNDDTFFYS